MRLRRNTALIASALAVAMTAAACGGGDDDGGDSGGGDQARKGGSLIYGYETEFPSNLMPYISAGNSVATAYMLIKIWPTPFEALPDFTIKADPDLMVEEPTSETVGGKQVVTYKINPNAVWSDGTPISAKDFIYTAEISKSADPAEGGCEAIINTAGYEQVEKVEGADGDKTVKLTFAKPFPDWKSLFVNPGLLPGHIMDKGDPKQNCAALTKGFPITSGLPSDITGGPWQIKKSNIDTAKQTIVLTPNEKFWGEKPNLDRLVYQAIGSDPGTTVKAMKSGEVQIVQPQPQLDLVKNFTDLAPKITSKTTFGLSFEHLDFNVKNFHLGQLPVRQAIAYALDRKALVDATVGQFDSRAQVLNNRLFVNNQPEYKDNSGGLYESAQIDKATELLEGAGYRKGADGIYAKDGKRLSLEMMTTVQNPLRENTIEVATSQLKKAGIEIKKFLNADIFEGPEKPRGLAGGQFDIGLFAWVSSPFVTPNIPIYRSVKGNAIGQNYSRGGDAKTDALLNQMSAETDPNKLVDIANQVDAELWRTMYTIPLYQKPIFLAYDSNFEGVQENATNAGPLWNSQKISVKQ